MTGWLAVAKALAMRPGLWTTALRTGAGLVPIAWWRRRPFLPVPDRRWMTFRLETAYGGDGTGPLSAADVITWLEWRRTFPTD